MLHFLCRCLYLFAFLLFSVLLTYSLKINSLLFLTHPVCLSVTSRYCIETTGQIELVWGMTGGFLPSIPDCYIEIRVFPKIRVTYFSVSLELCPKDPNSGLRKFRHGNSIVLSTKLIDGWARRQLHGCNTIGPRPPYQSKSRQLLHNCCTKYSWRDFDWQGVVRSVCSSKASCTRNVEDSTFRWSDSEFNLLKFSKSMSTTLRRKIL